MITAILYTPFDIPLPLWTAVMRRITTALDAATLEGSDQPQLLVMASRRDPAYEAAIPWQGSTHVVTGQRGAHDCYTKIIAGLALARFDEVYLLEHDVLYPEAYFRLDRRGVGWFVFQPNVWTLNRQGAWATTRRWLTSCCHGGRYSLRTCFTTRLGWIAAGRRIRIDEPGAEEPVNEGGLMTWDSPGESPVIDIRHGHNLTGDRDNATYCQTIPGWPGTCADIWRELEGK